MKDKGHIEIHLEELIHQANMSKLQFSYKADITPSQLTAYCRNQRKKLDIDILARMCNVLNCKLDDLMEYIPPSVNKKVHE